MDLQVSKFKEKWAVFIEILEFGNVQSAVFWHFVTEPIILRYKNSFFINQINE